jgi:polyphosphate glucokinase
MRILVIDVGGNNIKLRRPEQDTILKIPSGPELTAARMVRAVKRAAAGWKYDAVSIGYPGPVENGRPAREPHNLGGGWTRYDFRSAFGKPVRLLNDAAMQALGSYHGGRMLYLGLGTGLGSALVIHGVVQPLELAHLPYRKGRTFEDYVGQRGYERLGKRAWVRHVTHVVEALHNALQVEYIVLGGGSVKRLDALPPGCRVGSNANAFIGGIRLWATPHATRRPSAAPRVARHAGPDAADRRRATATT